MKRICFMAQAKWNLARFTVWKMDLTCSLIKVCGEQSTTLLSLLITRRVAMHTVVFLKTEQMFLAKVLYWRQLPK